MRSALASIVIVILGLWLGGLVTLVIFVSSLFVHDRTLASDAAPWLFHVFEQYQMGLAAASLATMMLWRLFARPWQRTVSLAAAMVGTILAGVEIGYITPQVNASRAIDPTTFQHYHHLATANYSTTTVFVLIALVFAVLSIKRRTPLV